MVIVHFDKRNQKRAEIKAKAEAGDPEAMAEYEAILEKGRQNNRKQAERMRKLRMADPEYRAKMEDKERLVFWEINESLKYRLYSKSLAKTELLRSISCNISTTLSEYSVNRVAFLFCFFLSINATILSKTFAVRSEGSLWQSSSFVIRSTICLNSL